jgi:hypothetical protein
VKLDASAADAAGNTDSVMGLFTAAAGFPVALLTTVKVYVPVCSHDVQASQAAVSA